MEKHKATILRRGLIESGFTVCCAGEEDDIVRHELGEWVPMIIHVIQTYPHM